VSLPYTVKKGDTLSAIAQRNGFKTWQEIYFHKDNEGFRRKRPNPNLIFPGDVIMLPDRGPPPPVPPPVPPDPPPAPELPTSQRFVVHHMGKETFAADDQDLFFHFTDMINGLIAIYWLQAGGLTMTTQPPPAKFVSPSSSFVTKGPERVNKLESLTAYFSRESEAGQRSSTLVMNLPSGAISCPMPHHLIGPGGLLSSGGPNSGGASTALTGTMRFVKMG